MSDELRPPEAEEEDEEITAPAWMATYADLATLLLTFFVLLLSFASMDVQNFQNALGSVREAMGVQFDHPGDRIGLTTSVVELSKRESTDQVTVVEMKLAELFRNFVKKQKLQDTVSVAEGKEGVIVRINEHVLFAPGEARLLRGAEKPLSTVGVLARHMKMPMLIMGHTDDLPIRTSRFPSNWELSAARAAAALRFLEREERVPRTLLGIAGYADTRPVASNNTAEGRTKNRRVEFLFIHDREMSERERAEHKTRQDKLRKVVEDGPADAPPPAPAARPPPPSRPSEPRAVIQGDPPL